MDPVGYGQALHCGTGNHWKGKSLERSQEPLLYNMYISGRFFAYGFYPIAVQKIVIEMLKNLNDPRFKRSAKPSNHQLSIVHAPPNVNEPKERPPGEQS
jgi:hypothetical protein